jgi:hypothetical protein
MQIRIRNLSSFYNLDLSVVLGATCAPKGDLYSYIIVSFFVFPTFSFLWLCFVYQRNKVLPWLDHVQSSVKYFNIMFFAACFLLFWSIVVNCQNF